MAEQLPRRDLAMTDVTGRIGRARAGEHDGCYVEVERDQSDTGWHIWVLQGDPRDGPSDGWDIWADDDDQLQEWLGVGQLNVEWIT